MSYSGLGALNAAMGSCQFSCYSSGRSIHAIHSTLSRLSSGINGGCQFSRYGSGRSIHAFNRILHRLSGSIDSMV
jgi:hypothetical protein